MTTVKVVLVNGNSWSTEINTDFNGAVRYYFGAGGFEQPDGSISLVDRVIELGKDGPTGMVVTADEFFRK